MDFAVDSSSLVRGWRVVRSIAEKALSWMRGARRSRWNPGDALLSCAGSCP